MLKMQFGQKNISTELPAFIMGIVNVTPDSFYKESRGGVERAFELIEQGANILDIGGESTRPGFTEVTAEEEIKRIIPVIKEIRKKSDIVISVDTRKASVFRSAFEAGADILNDVTSLEFDSEMLNVLAGTKASVILMHQFYGNEQERTTSPDVLKEVNNYFDERIKYIKSAGIGDERIILDSGIGFGKTFEENCTLIKAGGNLFDSKYPVLMALSRKRCIGTITDRVAEERLTGTICADFLAVQKGAKIVRVHDVKETLDSLKILNVLG